MVAVTFGGVECRAANCQLLLVGLWNHCYFLCASRILLDFELTAAELTRLNGIIWNCEFRA